MKLMARTNRLLGIGVLLLASSPTRAAQIQLIDSTGVVSAAASRTTILPGATTATTVEDERTVLFGFDQPGTSAGSYSANASATLPGGTAKASVSASWAVNKPSNVFVDAATTSGRIRITGKQSIEIEPASGFGQAGASAQVNLKFVTDGSNVKVDSVQSSAGGTTRTSSQGLSHLLQLSGGAPDGSILLFAFDDAPFLGSNPTIPMPSDSLPTITPIEELLAVISDNQDVEQPPPAHRPADIAGVNLTSHSSPVEQNGYGNTETTYFGGNIKSNMAANALLSNSQAMTATAIETHYSIGYLFLNNEGSSFTSFTLPDSLAGGDSKFRINVDGEGFDLSVGEVFDFTAFGSAGVDSFLLVGIDETEMIPTTADAPPFVFGMTFGAEGMSRFITAPLVPVPEPTTCVLLGMGAAFVAVSTMRRI